MKPTIIVEDNELSRKLIKSLIKHYNLPLEIIGEAENGYDAIQLIRKAHPFLVFMDINIPIYNGLEVINTIQNDITEPINFIIITAYGYFEYAQRSLRLGVKDLLLKPVDKSQFYNAVQNVLGSFYTENKLLNSIIDYIQTNYNSNITLKDCANVFYTSTNHISRLFKQHCNTTFTKYLNDYRITKAKDLLLDTNYTIEEIATMVGYNSPNYLYKLFKNKYNTTPNNYKKNSLWFV
ncbi:MULTISPECIES: response regulator transcription factor [unclassified Sedimentibacter]|uniref:response regulator transcription factor n=1 Tax=unclassified Sedimentibacter TaxID=2649220 RepID=UPI0027E07518|nr:helix-turn-helix domain-containing protein [Sedimentibacter sp. MB35-C1]WMJ77098.1 response regulator [Sedimentibacter sp. MB35-C1]